MSTKTKTNNSTTIRLKNNQGYNNELPNNALESESEQYISIAELESTLQRYDNLIKRYSDTANNLATREKSKQRVIDKLISERETVNSKLEQMKSQYHSLEQENERLRSESMKIKKVDPEKIKKYLNRPMKINIQPDEDEVDRMEQELLKKYGL